MGRHAESFWRIPQLFEVLKNQALTQTRKGRRRSQLRTGREYWRSEEKKRGILFGVFVERWEWQKRSIESQKSLADMFQGGKLQERNFRFTVKIPGKGKVRSLKVRQFD